MAIPSYLAPEPGDAELFDGWFDTLALSVRMANLACCLRDAGALCASFHLGWQPRFVVERGAWRRAWRPGCGRPAPEDC